MRHGDAQDRVAREQPLQGVLEGRGEASTRPVCVSKTSQDIGLELRVRNEFRQLVQGTLDTRLQGDPVDRRIPARPAPVVGPGDLDPAQAVLQVEQLDVVDLGPVVVLGRDGERGQDRELEPCLQLCCQVNGAERFVDGEQRAGEEAGLLAGGDEHPALVYDPLQPVCERAVRR